MHMADSILSAVELTGMVPNRTKASFRIERADIHDDFNFLKPIFYAICALYCSYAEYIEVQISKNLAGP